RGIPLVPFPWAGAAHPRRTGDAHGRSDDRHDRPPPDSSGAVCRERARPGHPGIHRRRGDHDRHRRPRGVPQPRRGGADWLAKPSYQASHDSLTGLINRTEFERRLGLALKSSAELSRNHAVMYLDLDQFKVVNDTCGHPAGDQLMRQVSAVLLKRLREGDTLARLGGDEFGVLLENCPPDHAVRIADQLRQTVTDIHFTWETRSFGTGVSVGLVNLKDRPFTLADVMSAADAACYMAKEKGRNRVQVYHSEDSEMS